MVSDRYREMLQGRSTFEIADQVPTTYYSTKPRSYYQAQPEGAAPEFVSELLDFFNLNRFNCPYIFLVLFISPEFEFPYAGARPLNGGVDTGAGVVEISSYHMDNRPTFQSTLQHELGHGFGLPHVDVYGYDMNTNVSIMSYNSAQWTNYFEPSNPGASIPEDIRALALNKLVFDNLVFDPMWDIPSGYLMAKDVVPLGPQDIPNNLLIGVQTPERLTGVPSRTSYITRSSPACPDRESPGTTPICGSPIARRPAGYLWNSPFPSM